MSNSNIVSDLKNAQLMLDMQKGKLVGFAENDVKFREDVVLVKDISNVNTCSDDIVIAYSENGNYLNIYQGVYTGNKLIGVREARLFDSEINEELTKPKDLVDFFSLDSSIKISRAKKYMEESTVRDSQLVFFAGTVRN